MVGKHIETSSSVEVWVWMCTQTHVCLHACIQECRHVCTCVQAHVCMFVYVCCCDLFVCLFVYVYVYVDVC
jgi:hypothetical protein